MNGTLRLARSLAKLFNTRAVQAAVGEVLPYFQQVAHEIPVVPGCVKRGVVFDPKINTDIFQYITPKGEFMNFLDYKGIFNRDDYGYVAFSRSDYVAEKFSGSPFIMAIKNACNGSIGLKIVSNPPLYNIDAEAVMASHIKEHNLNPQETDWIDGRECEMTGWHPDPNTPVVEESDILYIQTTFAGLPIGEPYVNTRYKPRQFTISTLSGCESEAQVLGNVWKKHQRIDPDDEPILPSDAKKIVEELSSSSEGVETIDLSTKEGLTQLKAVMVEATSHFKTIKQYYDRKQAQLFLDEKKQLSNSTDNQTNVNASEVPASFFNVSRQDNPMISQQTVNILENKGPI